MALTAPGRGPSQSVGDATAYGQRPYPNPNVPNVACKYQ